MIRQRLMRATAAFVIMLAACSGPDTMAPAPVESTEDAVLLRGLIGGVVSTTKDIVEGTLSAVPRLVPRLRQTVVTQYIGPAGGVVRGGGVELRIPAGALSATTSITLVVPAGLYHEVEFYPHGLEFKVPATLRFELDSSASQRNLVGSYFRLPILQGLISPVETFDAEVRNGGVEFLIEHFSRYAPAFRGYTAAGG